MWPLPLGTHLGTAVPPPPAESSNPPCHLACPSWRRGSENRESSIVERIQERLRSPCPARAIEDAGTSLVVCPQSPLLSHLPGAKRAAEGGSSTFVSSPGCLGLFPGGPRRPLSIEEAALGSHLWLCET